MKLSDSEKGAWRDLNDLIPDDIVVTLTRLYEDDNPGGKEHRFLRKGGVLYALVVSDEKPVLYRVESANSAIYYLKLSSPEPAEIFPDEVMEHLL